MPIESGSSRHRVVVIPHPPGPLPISLRHATTGIGLLAGLIVSICAYILAWAATITLAILCSIIVFVVPAGLILRRHHKTVANAARAADFGWRYALSAGIVVYLAIAFNVTAIAGDYVAEAFLVLLVGILALATAVVVASAAFTITWLVVRLTLPKFVLQDGTLCPICAYCLLGVQSMRCPECGNAFSFADLETTEHEFRARSKRATTE